MKYVVAALACSMLASIAFITAYGMGAQTQAEGAFAALSLAGLCCALLAWSKRGLPGERVEEKREALASCEGERARALEALTHGERLLARGGWVKALLFGALGCLGLAAFLPLRALGPAPGEKPFRTAWKPGVRLVREDGSPLSQGDLEVDSFITVFPEGTTNPPQVERMANSAALLIRVRPGDLRLAPERKAWAPDGFVAYSKVCTHAGCPVALYRKQTQQLLCPCHQSTFDVLEGARPVFGPATRALAQLPIEVSADGYFRALGDFPEAIGPGFWERG